MKVSKLSALICVITTSFSLTTYSDVLTTNAVADTSIFENFLTGNMGAYTDFAAGNTGGTGGNARGLIKFNLSGIPTNASITSASINLTVTKKALDAPGSTFALHRALQAWGEGSKNTQTPSPASTGEATWNCYAQPATWTPAGGGAGTDFVSIASATKDVDALGTYTFASTPELVNDVKFWITNSAQNFGMFLLSQNEVDPQTARRFASKESGVSVPSITVNYTIALPQANSPTITNITRTNTQFRFTFNAESNRTYTVQSIGSLTLTNWTDLTNFSAASVATNRVVTDTVGSTNKFYRVKTP